MMHRGINCSVTCQDWFFRALIDVLLWKAKYPSKPVFMTFKLPDHFMQHRLLEFQIFFFHFPEELHHFVSDSDFQRYFFLLFDIWSYEFSLTPPTLWFLVYLKKMIILLLWNKLSFQIADYFFFWGGGAISFGLFTVLCTRDT